MAGSLSGKCIVITGAASEIGRSTTLVAGREGARLRVSDRDLTGAEETGAELVEQGEA